MANLTKFQAKICFTAAGCLLHDGKILLIKHKKLGFWLCPGGHIEQNELPHQAAEREFWEETGVKVRAQDYGFLPSSRESQFQPLPYAANLHWISQANYKARLQGKLPTGKGCEQHYNLLYFMEAVGGLDFQENIEETDGIAWFGQEEIAALETPEAIKTELFQAFDISVRMQ